jgi:hypothetical protein
MTSPSSLPDRARRLWITVLSVFLTLAGLAVLWRAVIVTAQRQANEIEYQPAAGEPTPQRERQSDPDAPEISFIDSPAPTCYQPIPGTESCYIEWGYLQVSATSPQYIISMTVFIDDRLRAYYAGFFQTSMYVPPDLQHPGFRVDCGPPGASGIPGLGFQYNYTIRAMETGGLKAANYGAVTCPAGMYSLYLPRLQK